MTAKQQETKTPTVLVISRKKDASAGRKKHGGSSKKSKNNKISMQNTALKPNMILNGLASPSGRPSAPVSPSPEKVVRDDCPTPDLSGAESADEAHIPQVVLPPPAGHAAEGKNKPRQPAPKKWSAFEDQVLKEGQTQLGNNWNEIRKLLPGRTKGSASNRWRSQPFKEKLQRGIVPSAEVVKLVSALAVKVSSANAATQLPHKKRPIPDPTRSANAIGGGVSLPKCAPVHASTATAAAAPRPTVPIKTASGRTGSVAPPQAIGSSRFAGQRGQLPMLVPPPLPPIQPPAKKQKIGPPAFASHASRPIKKEQQIVGAARPHAWAREPWAGPMGAASVLAAKSVPSSPSYENCETVVAKTVFGTIPVAEPDTVIHHRPLNSGSKPAAKGTSPTKRSKVSQRSASKRLSASLRWDFDDGESIECLPFDHVLEDAFCFGGN